jgi:hypothetical protein
MIKLIFSFVSLFSICPVFAQVTTETILTELPPSTLLYSKSDFEVPSNSISVVLDSGAGKSCSCQFFTEKKDYDRTINSTDQLLIDMIKVKGIFDGSQMHIARIYLKGNIGYFKLKCYSRRMMLEHALEFFDISIHTEQVFIP